MLGQQGAGKGQPLSLTAGKTSSPLANIGAVASGQLHNEIMGAGQPSGMDNGFTAGIGIG